MKVIHVFSLLIFLLISCKSVQLGSKLDPKTDRFHADNANVKLINEISIDANLLKPLLLVEYDRDLEPMKSLNFFNAVMTNDQFEDTIIKAGIADEVKSFRNRKGQHIAATLFRTFVLLEHYYGKSTTDVGIRLYDPITEKVIFESEMRYGVLSLPQGDPRYYLPLYNSLLDYLRKQH